MADWQEVSEDDFHDFLAEERKVNDIGQTNMQLGSMTVYHLGHDYRGQWVAKHERVGKDHYYYISTQHHGL